MKRLSSIVTALACIILLCGCGGWIKIDSLTFTSIQSDDSITLKVTGKAESDAENTNGCIYSTNKSKEIILEELKQNDVVIFTENGFDFLRPSGDRGVYYLNIQKSAEVDTTKVRIDDMGRLFKIFIDDTTGFRTILKQFPFPHFMLETITDRQDVSISIEEIILNEPYLCDGLNLLSLVKTLGIWEVEEKENSFIMSFKEDKVEVVYGDGTVTLQPVA